MGDDRFKIFDTDDNVKPLLDGEFAKLKRIENKAGIAVGSEPLTSIRMGLFPRLGMTRFNTCVVFAGHVVAEGAT